MNPGTWSTFPKRTGALLAMLLGSIQGFPQAAKPQHAKLSLIAEHASLAPGRQEGMGIRFELEPGWHIYWTNPGDSGEPPQVTWHVPNGMQASNLEFPTPQRLADHGMTDYGYLGDVVLLSKLAVPAKVASKQAEISADVRYLVCREVCIPGKEHLSLLFEIRSDAKVSADADLIHKAERQRPQSLPAGVHVSAVSGSDSFVITVAGQKPGVGPVVDFIPAEPQVIENSSKPRIAPGIDQEELTLKKSDQLSRPVPQLRGLIITKERAYNVAVPVSRTKATSSTAISQNAQTAKKSKE